MLDADDANIFIGKNIGAVYTDSGKDFVLKGVLKKVTLKAILIDNQKHGRAIISLDSIKKIFEVVENG